MVEKIALTELNSHVLLGKPQQAAPESSSGPALVLLFGYMDARMPHLQKYVGGLSAQFPGAEIVVIRSFTDYFWSSTAHVEKTLLPVVDILKGHAEKSNPSILVHILSNGGGFHYMTLLRILQTLPSRAPVASIPTALILDSTPGDVGLQTSLAFAAPSNPVLRLLSLPPLCLFYGAYLAAHVLLGKTNIFTQLRAALHEATIFPTVVGAGAGKGTPRMYLYSKKDRISDPVRLQAHVDEAKSAGLDVTAEVYDDAPHVGLARVHPERYWASVKRFWEYAVNSE
ncbi:Transmembrane protein 53 [Mycena kentingensis (nom. inval.)]|nr:Transmembrane protein 53 [Mycena kentingensis (nom. inval.)]